MRREDDPFDVDDPQPERHRARCHSSRRNTGLYTRFFVGVAQCPFIIPSPSTADLTSSAVHDMLPLCAHPDLAPGITTRTFANTPRPSLASHGPRPANPLSPPHFNHAFHDKPIARRTRLSHRSVSFNRRLQACSLHSTPVTAFPLTPRGLLNRESESFGGVFGKTGLYDLTPNALSRNGERRRLEQRGATVFENRRLRRRPGDSLPRGFALTGVRLDFDVYSLAPQM